jgi:signal transduction histidine kinase
VRTERSERAERRSRGPARAEAAAALIFDPRISAFVWANGAGLLLFGVKSLARLAQDRLDRALPAAARLIAFAEAEASGPADMTLDFWTPRGPVHLEAVVERLALSRDQTGVLIRSGGVVLDRHKAEAILNGPAHELHVVESETAARFEAQELAPVVEAQCRQSLEISREDQETLREIARLIREGELTTLPERPVQAAAAPPPPEVPAAMPVPAATAPIHQTSGDETPASIAFDSDPMRLLAEVAHELRTPLTAVRGYGELIAAKPADPRVGDRAHHIVDAADHALALIADILDARQIAMGQAGLVFTDVDLAAELAQTAAMLAPQAAKAGISLIVEAGLTLPKVVADARRVRQVLVNLASNAVKFTATGGTVRLGGAFMADGHVEVTVADTGRGAATSETGDGRVLAVHRRGNGIGLPLSRALAEANGARLSVESRPGAGTLARLVFPASCVVPP